MYIAKLPYIFVIFLVAVRTPCPPHTHTHTLDPRMLLKCSFDMPDDPSNGHLNNGFLEYLDLQIDK